ncbi:MAG: hypothetical protein R2849_05795 [Thermomicrobiales bacterium]
MGLPAARADRDEVAVRAEQDRTVAELDLPVDRARAPARSAAAGAVRVRLELEITGITIEASVVVDIKQVVGLEFWMERQSEEPELTGIAAQPGIDHPVGKIQEKFAVERVDPAALR